ncbi:MAG: hypothetical protein JSU72_09805 [Deltaproteobacteria bacterium]|nr:MAG: hypothetical protein JSU72_09805 [Deltaproteobacteria bacterium]
MWSDIITAVRELDLQRLNEIMAGVDAWTLLKNPYVIAVMVIACLVFIIRGMERALVTFLSIPAFLVLFQKTVQGADVLDFEPQRLLIFIGGFLAIAALNIYFYFVRK